MSKNWFAFKRNINSMILIALNGLVAIFNPVTTFCIMDVKVRNFSRVVQIITVGLLLTTIILNFSSIPKLALLIFNSFILVSQILVIIYIFVDNSCYYLSYLSAKIAFTVALITLLDRIVEIVHFLIINKKDKYAIANIS
jgi:hypothetical protein